MKAIVTLSLAAALCLSAAGTLARAAGQVPEPPAPELKKLDFLVGRSNGKGKMYLPGQPPADWTDGGTTSWALGGRYLRSTSSAVFPGMGKEESLEMFCYDAKAKVYRFWRYSSMEAQPTEAEGNFDGAKLVLMTKPDTEGQVYRATWEP